MTALSPLTAASANLPSRLISAVPPPTAAKLCARISVTFFDFLFGGIIQMMQYALVCLLLAAMAWGQAANPTSTPPAQQQSAPPIAAGSPPENKPAENKDAEAAKVP